MSDYFGKEIFTKCVGVFEKKKYYKAKHRKC